MTRLQWIFLCWLTFLVLLDGKLPVSIHLHFHVSAKPKSLGPKSSGVVAGFLLLGHSHALPGKASMFKSSHALVKIADFIRKRSGRKLLKEMLAEGYKPVITRAQEKEWLCGNKGPCKHLPVADLYTTH